MWGCPGGHDCSDHVLLQPRVQATPPHSLGVSRSRGGRRRTGTAVPQLLGPVTAAGRRFTGSPSPSALQEAQAEELAPVLRPQPLCCPQGSPETAGLPARDPGQDGAGSASGASVQPLPAAPHPRTLRALHCASPAASLSQVHVQTKGKVGAEQDTQE